MGGHPPYLAVASLIEGDFQPAGGDRFALADGRIPRPQPLWFRNPLHAGGQSRAVIKRDAVAERGQRVRRGFTFHLNIINFTGALTRLSERRLQRAVVGQYQQAFAIAIQPTGSVDAGNRNKIF